MSNNNKGNTLTFYIIFVLLFVLVLAVSLEVYRDYTIKQNIDIELSRAVNIAIDMGMADSYRQDRVSKVNSDRAEDEFYSYLKDELKLDETMKYSSTTLEYQLFFNQISTQSEPPSFEVSGHLEIDPVAFQDLIDFKINIPFKVKSRNKRFD